MSLNIADHEAMVAGIIGAGYTYLEKPTHISNPIALELLCQGQLRRFRLWAFDITGGGGGPTVRAADEFRIQITNGPASTSDFDAGGATDLLVGYSRTQNVIVAYDRRWLENWTSKAPASRGSPSVQVKLADINAGQLKGMHRFTKDSTSFGQANIIAMTPDNLLGFLLNPQQLLTGAVQTRLAVKTTQSISSISKVTVFDYCRDRGFNFEPDLLARYIASFLAKPFVILAGVSGTGKSKIAELVAEYYSLESSTTGSSGNSLTPIAGTKFAFEENIKTANTDRFAFIPVRPDWTDNQSILGYVNPISNQYESTNTLDLILKASKKSSLASIKGAAPRFFLLLDEMNLARVEHYFSDWLACTESRRLSPDGSILQQGIPLHRFNATLKTNISISNVDTECEIPRKLELPTNLVVTGTVNVDETTHGFSPKVLDRSMVIEFDSVDLEGLRKPINTAVVNDYSLPLNLADFELASKNSYALLPESTHKHLVAINSILEESRLHLGYRSANEIALFMRIYNDMLPATLKDVLWSRPLDISILQKILPRVSGSRSKVESALVKICIYARDLELPDVPIDQELDFDLNASAKLSNTYTRAIEMLTTARDFGFVSFFK